MPNIKIYVDELILDTSDSEDMKLLYEITARSKKTITRPGDN